VSREIFLSERFRAVVREFPKPVRIEVGGAIDRLQSSFGDPQRHAGLGIRKMVKNYFEIRVGLDLRLVFRVERNEIIFAFAGTHDQVRKFLRQL
jgi:mRNA-degrading endonuclease RelE of RelBE toxin-antitoxin system